MKFFLLSVFFFAIVSELSAALSITDVADCNNTLRDTINPATGLPYCIKVGILSDQGVDSYPLTHGIPWAMLNETIKAYPKLAATPIFINHSSYGYDGGIEAIRRNEFDLYIGDIWSLSRRSPGVDWSQGFAREFIGLAFIAESPRQTSFGAMFDPLTLDVWLLAAGLLIAGSLLLFIVEWMHPVADDVPNPPRMVYRFAFWRSLWRCFDAGFMTPFGAGRFNAMSASGFSIQLGLKFFFLVFIESYIANLASFLTVSGAAARTSLTELLLKWVLGPGGGNASNDFAQAAGAKVSVLKDGESTDPATLRARMDENEFLGSYVQGQTIIFNQVDKHCDLRYIPLPFSVDTVLPFREHPATATFRRLVDTTILTLRQNGTVSDLYSIAYAPESERCTNSRLAATDQPDNIEDLQLGLMSMRGLFTVTVAIMGFGLIMAIILRIAANVAYGNKPAEEEWEIAKPKIKWMTERCSGAVLPPHYHDVLEAINSPKETSPVGSAGRSRVKVEKRDKRSGKWQ